MLIPDSTSFESLLNYFSFFGWLAYGLTISSVLWFRYKRPNDRRPYKVNHNVVPPFVYVDEILKSQGGSPLYDLYGYVPLDRVWFLAFLS